MTNQTETPIPDISSIESKRRKNPDTESSDSIIKIWFENGGAVRIQDNGTTITQSTFLPNYPDSVWDEHTVCDSKDSNKDEVAMMFLTHLTEHETLNDLEGIFAEDVIKTLTQNQ